LSSRRHEDKGCLVSLGRGGRKREELVREGSKDDGAEQGEVASTAFQPCHVRLSKHCQGSRGVAYVWNRRNPSTPYAVDVPGAMQPML
jgi:hypothetical protein